MSKPQSQSCTGKASPVIAKTNTTSSLAKEAKAKTPTKGNTAPSTKQVDPKPSADDPCTNVFVCAGTAGASECFPKWTITKTANGTQCFNANGAENPSASYTVTVTNPSITRPPDSPDLCWNVTFSVSNSTGSPITLGDILANLVISGHEIDHTVDSEVGTVIQDGQARCITLAFCDDISPICFSGATPVVQITVAYTCGGAAYTTAPPLDISLPIELTCTDDSCYVFADAAQCIINGIPDGSATVAITAISPTSFDATACPELSAIATQVNGGVPFPLPVGGLVLICAGCFTPAFPQIEFTIEASCPDLPTDCSTTYAITNVAEITKVVQVSPTEPCPPNSNQATTLEGTVVCVSTLGCDTSSATATADITCVVPAICVTTNVQCNENLCICKRSTVIASPPSILYDVTFSETSDAGCTFTVTFVFVACPSTQYTYQIQTVTGGVPTTIVGPLSATPCPVGTPITTSTDGCNTCTTLPLPACAITSPAIPFTEVAGVDSLQITITGPDGEVIIPATNICIPSEQGGESVCLGDCITITCNPPPAPPATCCVFDPTAPGAVAVVSTGNLCTDAQLLALLIGNGNVTFPPGCTPITGTPTNPSASVTGILNVACGEFPDLLSLVAEEITLIETHNLHFTIQIPSTCCGCITVKNAIRLLTGSPDCDPTPPSSCTSSVVVSDQNQALYNTIQLPQCCPLPVITSLSPPNFTVNSGVATDVPFTIMGNNFLPLTVLDVTPSATVSVNSVDVTTSTDTEVAGTINITAGSSGTLTFAVTTSCGESNTETMTITILGAKPAIKPRAILPASKSDPPRPSSAPKSNPPRPTPAPKSKVVVRSFGMKK